MESMETSFLSMCRLGGYVHSIGHKTYVSMWLKINLKQITVEF